MKMNKSSRLSASSVIASAIVLVAQSARSQWIFTGNAYQNSTTSFDANYNFANGPGTTQAGNEVVLAGTAPMGFISSFAFQYDFTGHGSKNATAVLTFYANNGTPTAATAGYYPPGQPLFTSAPESLGNFTPGATMNFGLADLGGGVEVPQDFTWTVTFSGLSAGQCAGLALYGQTTVPDVNTATVGANYGDAWENLSGSWDLISGVGPYPATFGAVINVPDSSSLPFSMGTVVLALGWMKRFARKA